MNAHLLIIDPQNDFCDLPAGPQGEPALPVAGADADMRRLAALLMRMGSEFERIHVTLDSHHPVDIAHACWWEDAHGSSPAAFTTITAGKWRARDPALREWSESYLAELAAAGKYPLTIWPEHCLIGTWGHNVHKAVAVALSAWAKSQLKTVDYVLKGDNPLTEHYSAIRAEVEDAADAGTQRNAKLMDQLDRAGVVYVAGEALSHCVASTIRDIVADIRARDPGRASSSLLDKFVLLSDCTSPVPGFEAMVPAFIAEIQALGMRVQPSTTIFKD